MPKGEMQTRSFYALSEELSNDQEIRLSIILSRLESGDSTVLITPVGKRVGPDELFESWKRIFDKNSNRMNSILQEIEMNQAEKYGPRSIAKPYSEVRDQFLETYNNSDHPCEHISSIPPFSRHKGILRPTGIERAFEGIKKNTNSGLPYLMRTSKILNELKNDLYSDYDKDYPTVPFVRTQELGKTRIVNGFPKSDIIIEYTYFQPLFDYYRKLPCYAGMRGPSEVDTAMTKLIYDADRLGLTTVSGDISSFDASFGIPLQDKCFDEMKYLINSEFHDDFEVIRYRFGNKPMVLPDGVYTGSHGIPSGSQFTNLVGSVGNRKVSGIPMELLQVLGDDFAAATNNPELLFQRYADCGMELNEDKTMIASGYYLYLQNLYHPDYMVDGEIRGVYPTFRALGRLVYPERFSDFESFDLDGKSYFAIRSLSILENCRNHPLFEEFVKWWLKYEKYAIPSNKSIANYVKYINATTGTLGTTNQRGDDIRGLTNFKSYQLAVKYG